MRFLASLLVGHPLRLAAVAALFLAAYAGLRVAGGGAGRQPRPLLWAALAWGLYAGWEWLVQARSPGANIRADLLLIWPVVAAASIWAVVRVILSRP